MTGFTSPECVIGDMWAALRIVRCRARGIVSASSCVIARDGRGDRVPHRIRVGTSMAA
jgi:hypothetical protein